MKKKIIDPIKQFYFRFERPLSALGLVSGFVFDAVTLKRVDLLLENLWVIVHLVVVGLCIFLLNKFPKKGEGSTFHFWLVFIMQFTFGGILSTYLVFYFRSATLASSWPFLLLLVAAFVSNEAFKQHYTRLTFQISLFFLSIYSFAIFFVPVLLHKISPGVFVFSGFVSLAILWCFLATLWYWTRERFLRSRTILYFTVGGIFLLINVLYFTNLIPPIPLALKDAGVYHDIIKTADGEYKLVGESEQSGIFNFLYNWKDYIRSYTIFHEVPGQPVYVYTAVFSPTALDTTVIHNWQKYNDSTKKWESQSRIELSILGGRERGYRVYSKKYSIEPGLWRVDVETKAGQDIGRVKFKIE